METSPDADFAQLEDRCQGEKSNVSSIHVTGEISFSELSSYWKLWCITLK